MATDRDKLIEQLAKIANELDSESDLRGVKCALYTLLGAFESGVPEHMKAFHHLCYDFSRNMKEDLERRIEEEKTKPATQLRLIH
jgi:hypothetical protein